MKIEMKQLVTACLTMSIADGAIVALMYFVANGIIPLCLALFVVVRFVIQLYISDGGQRLLKDGKIKF